MTLWNLILEPLEERYTKQWAEWSMRDFSRHFTTTRIVFGKALTETIETGKVLDANGTIYWKSTQMANVAEHFKKGNVRDGDIFFLHDLQYPGWEAIKYMAELNGVYVRVYGFLHASSWTEGDFAQPMEPWLAPYEVAWINAVDGAFVGTQYHKDKIVAARKLPKNLADKIHVTGNPIDIEVYRAGVDPKERDAKKENWVAWPHRFHPEKNPAFAVDVVDWFVQSGMYSATDEPVTFYFRSPDKAALNNVHTTLLLKRLESLRNHVNVEFYEPKSKEDYYTLLHRSKVVWSTSLEESFGYCTVEGIALGCHPVLPVAASHVEIVMGRERYLYNPRDIEGCVKKIVDALKAPSPPTLYIERYEESFDNMAEIMTGE